MRLVVVMAGLFQARKLAPKNFPKKSLRVLW